MGRTLAELLDTVDPAEFALWVAAEQVLNLLPDPWAQSATVAAAIYNASPFTRSNVRPTDFIPRPPSSSPADDDEDDLAKFDRLVPLG